MSTIQFWAADRGACGHYRCVLPGAALEAEGHTVRVDTILDAQALCTTDVVVGQRICLDPASHTWQTMARATNRGLLVFEMDDDFWSLPRERHNPAALEWTPRRIANVESNLAVADVVTCSTWQLAELAREHTTAPIHVVPNAIPDSLIGSALEPRPRPRHLGWSGSSTHDGDWLEDDAARAVLFWIGRHKPWSLEIIGRMPEPIHAAAVHTPGGFVVSTREGTRDVDAYYAMVRKAFDVGLAPLARTAFNRSKSDLRLLELAAMGIPWIATDFGPYATEGEATGGWWVRNHTEWRDALTGMAEEYSSRKRLAQRGQEWARTRTVSAVLPKWKAALGL